MPDETARLRHLYTSERAYVTMTRAQLRAVRGRLPRGGGGARGRGSAMKHALPRVLLVGESNPYGVDPRYALYPAPAGSAGAHLCRGILGMTAYEYLRTFERVNLLTGPKWSAPWARQAAEALTAKHRVLLGARVAAAHGLEFKPFTTARDPAWDGGWLAVVLPHPSGRSRLWNDKGAADHARRLVLDLVALAGGAAQAR